MFGFGLTLRMLNEKLESKLLEIKLKFAIANFNFLQTPKLKHKSVRPIPATKSKDYKLLIMLIVFSMFIDYAPKPVKLKRLI